MKNIYFVCILLFVGGYSLAQEQDSLGWVIKDDTPVRWIPNGYVYTSMLVDSSCQLGFSDVLAADSLGLFKPTEGISPRSLNPMALWMKLEITNETAAEQFIYLSFSARADTVLLYEVIAGETMDVSQSGYDFDPLEKKIPSQFSVFLVTLPKETTGHYYARVHFSKDLEWEACAVTGLSLQKDESMRSNLLKKYAGQAFYAGLMLMFSFLSLFIFLLFKDRDFLYFSMVQVSFILYFLEAKNSFLGLVYNVPFVLGIPLGYWTTSFLILSLSLFISEYLRFRQKNKRFFIFHSVVCSATVFSPIFFALFLNNPVPLGNFVILIWIIVSIIPMVRQALRGDKQALNLVPAVGLMELAGVVDIFKYLGVLPRNFFTINSFQISSVLFSLFIFFRLFGMVRRIDNEKQKAHSLNELKSKFFTNISHEFRTPLTLIMGPLRQLIDKSTDAKDVKLMEGALKNSQRLLNMVNQLLDLSRIEGKELDIRPEKIKYGPFVKGVLMSFESLAQTRRVDIGFKAADGDIELWCDLEKMEIILFNLLSNAFKYTPEGGRVSVSIEESGGQVKVLVEDTGVGIPKEQLPYVFDRFFRVENSGGQTAVGSGIGLSLAKELVGLHGGGITVESKVGEGTVFSLLFKKGNAHFLPEQLDNTGATKAISSQANVKLLAAELQAPDSAGQAESSILGKRPTILLVEDNPDVRHYLKSLLVERFEILEAADGREGLDIAIERMPELVISDVMMPVMDGMEFCRLIKKDVRTSHIPVILLTAKVGNESKLEGLELGADEYLTKPFHAKELNIRVRKLIELRVRLREKLLESPTLTITGLEGNPVESRFLEQVATIVNDNIDNPQLGVEMLAEAVGMSRSQLNRKLNSIAGMSTNKYIRHVRLQKALSLLENEDSTASEVAFKVGFNSVAYFVKCFKDKYGETPGAFQKKK